jgi:hypothetical protein
MTGAAAVLGQDMAAFASGLRAAELKLTGWLGASELAGVIRGAYDPTGSARLEGTGLGQGLATEGPVAVEEHWDIRHDSGYSAVLWVSQWQRIDVPPKSVRPGIELAIL